MTRATAVKGIEANLLYISEIKQVASGTQVIARPSTTARFSIVIRPSLRYSAVVEDELGENV